MKPYACVPLSAHTFVKTKFHQLALLTTIYNLTHFPQKRTEPHILFNMHVSHRAPKALRSTIIALAIYPSVYPNWVPFGDAYRIWGLGSGLLAETLRVCCLCGACPNAVCKVAIAWDLFWSAPCVWGMSCSTCGWTTQWRRRSLYTRETVEIGPNRRTKRCTLLAAPTAAQRLSLLFWCLLHLKYTIEYNEPLVTWSRGMAIIKLFNYYFIARVQCAGWAHVNASIKLKGTSICWRFDLCLRECSRRRGCTPTNLVQFGEHTIETITNSNLFMHNEWHCIAHHLQNAFVVLYVDRVIMCWILRCTIRGQPQTSATIQSYFYMYVNGSEAAHTSIVASNVGAGWVSFAGLCSETFYMRRTWSMA